MSSPSMLDAINNIIESTPELHALFKQPPRYRFWMHKDSKDMYCYSVNKLVYKGKARYVSWIYRYYKTKKGWKMLNNAGSAKKRGAMDRAERLFKARA